MVGIQARMASGVDGDFFLRQEDNSLCFSALRSWWLFDDSHVADVHGGREPS